MGGIPRAFVRFEKGIRMFELFSYSCTTFPTYLCQVIIAFGGGGVMKMSAKVNNACKKKKAHLR